MAKHHKAILQVTPEFMIQLLSAFLDYKQAPVKFRITKNGIPLSARLSHMFTDNDRGFIGIVLEDASFPETEHGSLIPILPAPEFSVERE